MLSQIRPAITMIVFFTLLVGLALPVGFSGLAGIVLPFQARGSLLQKGNTTIGSAQIGQNFTSARYFRGRPSALMGADPKDSSKQVPTPYDASESGASNLAPTSQALLARVKGDVARLGRTMVPGDAVTTSASGLDPDISPENAAGQVARVAAARGLSAGSVQALVDAHTKGRMLGVLGMPHVNVLELNLALDSMAKGQVNTAGK